MSYNQQGIINNNFKHGETGTKLHRVWINIKYRCSNSKYKQYKDYGGRGITTCPEWTDKENGFINFRDWALNNGYQEGLEIDRRNNDGNYEPSNCRWVLPTDNCKNRRNNVMTLKLANKIRELYNTGNYYQKELSIKYNISIATIFRIINNKQWKNV